jgi:enterochelin esterase-like enzyme
VYGDLLAFIDAAGTIDPDPARRVIAGHSLGGLAALHLAATRPDTFGAVAVGSAALWWPGAEDGMQIVGSDVVDTAGNSTHGARIWMEVGTIEGPELFAENQRFHRLLRESGRDVRYREVVGSHDLATWRGGIGDALAHLLGN